MNDAVNHPDHYNSHPSGIECIDIAEHMSFSLGNAVKYLLRCKEKGKEKEDVGKAIFYIDREITRLHSCPHVISQKVEEGLMEVAATETDPLLSSVYGTLSAMHAIDASPILALKGLSDALSTREASLD